jgi:predicted RNase H-like nuclease
LDAAARYLAAGRPPRAPGGNPPADVTLVTVDLPVALGPVTRRREADDAVSRAFARAKCGTHSPTATRPGPLADRMRAGLAALGFALATAATAAGTARHLVEVYPHPALLALCAREVRLPYKVAKARAYWPSLTRAERAECLAKQYAHIAAALAAAGVRDIPDELRTPEVPATPGRLKPVEDQIDALVCAWVGVEYLRGRARAYGDSEAAIWIPARR